jgi:serine phosphatase RsbU (regulator of sigma subunit)
MNNLYLLYESDEDKVQTTSTSYPFNFLPIYSYNTISIPLTAESMLLLAILAFPLIT